MVLANSKAFSGFAVDDLERAREFYEGTLGLDVSDDGGLVTLNLPGDRPTDLPEARLHARDVHDPQLPGRGHRRGRGRARCPRVEFARYEGFEQDGKGIARMEGGPPIAWFTDPAGSILAVLEE